MNVGNDIGTRVCKSIVREGIGVVMEETQKRILNWLTEVEPELGKLYEGAVRMVKERSFPGRGRFICHAVREIRNRLPDAVAGKGEAKRLEYAEEVALIAEAWEKAGLEGAYEKQSGMRGGEPEKQVPREVLVSVDQLVRRHMEVGGRKEKNAKRLLIALEPENKMLQGSLGPVVKRWLEETEWFVGRSHIRRTIDESELIEHFEIFENVLASLVGFFYERFDRIDQIVRDANTSGSIPSDGEVRETISFLVRARFRMHFFSELENPYWIEPLKDAGFFKIPEDAEEGEAYERWPEGWYLKKVSSKVPEEVLGIISGATCRNPYIRNTCSESLLEMPVGVAANGGKIVENILPRGRKEGNLEWAWIGQPCAKLMVKLIEEHPNEAFEIAWILLDVWVPSKSNLFEDMVTKFTDHDYRELVLKYCAELWKIEPKRAFWVLAKLLNRCLEELDKKKGFDVSSHFYIGNALRDLDGIDLGRAGIKAILVKGMCEAGKVLIDKQPEKVNGLLNGLEKLNRAIFTRIEMYLLRFVGSGLEKDRVNRIIQDTKYLEEPGYEYEYKLLLRDKFDEVSDKVENAFVEWVKEEKVNEERRKEIREWCERNNEAVPDFEKMEYRAKAEELYLVRERFEKLYEEYKGKAGVKNDDELAPRRMVGEVRDVSPTEGTPLESEAMGKMSVGEILGYVSEPKNYEGKVKADEWRDPVDALRTTFKEDVKKRPIEYLKEGREKLENLPAEFLSSFFYGVSEAVREGSFDKEGWGDLIELAHKVVQGKQKEEGYRNCFSAMLSTLRDGFSERENKMKFDEEKVRKFWEIIEALVHFPIGDMSGLGEERDPVQISCNMVAGQAMELTVPLGIVCKRNFEGLFDKYLRVERQKCYEYVLEKIRQPGVNYVFGLDFARIYWTDKEWVEENIENIFCDELWDETWGTYVSWGRPSANGFKLLVEKGKYRQAVDLIGEENKYKFQKEPDEGLVEHLIIGFFNGWIGFDDDLLKAFFEKASAELRGTAARFMTTGFKSVNEEGGEKEKIKVATRMKEYWEKRLATIKEKKEENKDEAIELTGWVEDSVLPAKETLELLEQSLDLSGGKIGKMRDARDFVEGVSKLGKGNELLALRCLKKAAADENMHMPWANIQEPLVKFLEKMMESPENVQSEAREVADLYGRYNPEKFREVWEKLRK